MTPRRRTGDAPTPRKIDRDLAAVLRTIDDVITACREGVDRLQLVKASTRSIGTALDLDKMLAWKLLSLADAADAAAAVRFLPGQRGWTRICTAFEGHGHAAHATALQDAWRAFQSALDVRQLTRSRLEDLLSAASREPTAAAANDPRSALSDAFASIWGVREAAFLSTWILSPATVPDRLSAGWIKLHHGLHRTRPGPEWNLQFQQDAHRIPDVPEKDQPEQSDAPWQDVPCFDLMTEAAEREIERPAAGDSGMVTFHGRGTSPRRPIDIVLADHASPVAYQYAREPGEYGSFGNGIRVPAGLFVYDMLLDARMPWPSRPEAITTFRPDYVTNVAEVRQQQRMPMTESSEAPIAAPGDDDLTLPGPLGRVDAMYRGALDRVLARMELDLSQLVLHRLVVPSPVLASTVSLRWLLPNPPM